MWRPKICYKSSSGMGGGGGGGISSPIRTSSLPSLQGSEKQVVWAESIRRNAIEQFNDFAYAASKVLSGNGSQRPNMTGEKQFVRNGNMFPTYKKYVDSVGASMRKFMGSGKLQGPTGNDKIRDALKRMRNNITTQKDARYWIDRK